MFCICRGTQIILKGTTPVTAIVAQKYTLYRIPDSMLNGTQHLSLLTPLYGKLGK